jgi:hypothetical protein
VPTGHAPAAQGSAGAIRPAEGARQDIPAQAGGGDGQSGCGVRIPRQTWLLLTLRDAGGVSQNLAHFMDCSHAHASANRDKIAVFPSASAVLNPFPSGKTPLITLNDLCAPLLPPHEQLTCKTLLIAAPHLILVAAMMSPKSPCPACRQPTDRSHSRASRPLAAFPWATTPLALRFTVRRFFCRTCTCARQPCSARLPTSAPLYARPPTRLATAQARTGLS